jgi:hypothetical protein
MKQIVAVIGLFTLLFFGSPAVPGQNTNGAANASKNGLKLTLPNKVDSVRFMVIGDTGTGKNQQAELGEWMAQYHAVFPFEFVLMVGDNLYGGEKAEDYTQKFEQPYKKLLDKGVKFYAALGNHDNPNQRFYKNFNMGGKDYYTFKKGPVRFFVLNSNYMDERQVRWLETELKNSGSDWKLCFFHHPIYSSGGRHGPNLELRKIVEPTFVKYGVDAAFMGHEHFYERFKPQQGIYYFITGAGGKIEPDGVKRSSLTEKSFDQDHNFMLVEIAGDQMHFQVVSRAGKTVDAGALPRREVVAAK